LKQPLNDANSTLAAARHIRATFPDRRSHQVNLSGNDQQAFSAWRHLVLQGFNANEIANDLGDPTPRSGSLSRCADPLVLDGCFDGCSPRASDQ